ncbi:MAG: hypothetical protein KAT74_05495, partial [Candidatus Cloacimonetes bacterium]|nr:hypothetical protein [Candidatus Cloacimonadota bacterium]
MSVKTYKIFKRIAWYLFFLFLFLNVFNWIFSINEDVFIKKLPFDLKKGYAENIQYPALANILNNKIITYVDTIKTFIPSGQSSISSKIFNHKFRFRLLGYNKEFVSKESEIRTRIFEFVSTKDEVEITFHDIDTKESSSIIVETINTYDRSALLSLIFNIVFIFFIFFNTYLLLNFSQTRENIFIVFFLLFFSCPEELPFLNLSNTITFLIIPFLGVLFYHFIVQKISPEKKLKVIYSLSLLLSISIYLFYEFYKINLEFILFIWSIAWLLIGFILLWRSYKKTQLIELKRLINAFRGIVISLVSISIGAILVVIFTYFTSGSSGFQIYSFYMIILMILIICAGLGFFVGILWFFGSFTWSLLTGTVLDVKIRSTLIYTIVGLVFVTIFGFVDYTLGELLQSLFGNFIGSEFIAGIPATIGLLAFFNPIRNKVESIVDTKLNTSDLDFLEKTDTFTNNLSGESVIEGFEEYICENLIHRLPIKKVALVSFDKELNYFKFNEIRGSDVKENSKVEDIHSILSNNEIYESYIINEDQQEISSFSMVVPIIFEEDYKWFLALGKKNDGTAYSKKDEKA